MDAWMKAWTLAGRGVPKFEGAGTGETTLTTMVESARVFATSLRWASQRGTRPMSRPMTIRTAAISAIRRKGMGGGGGGEGAVEFMALFLCYRRHFVVPMHKTKNDRDKKQRGNGGQHEAADDGAAERRI